jgi:peroxiredoxin
LENGRDPLVLGKAKGKRRKAKMGKGHRRGYRIRPALLPFSFFLPTGCPAPAFALPDIHGRQVRLDDYRGQIVVLNFWAFWCDTWKAEMPHLQELIPRQEELGFRLIAISVDGTRLPEFEKRTAGGKIPFPVLMDIGGQVCARYKVAHVPTIVIIDGAGRVRYTASGYPGNHVVLREVRKLAPPGEANSKAVSLLMAGG